MIKLYSNSQICAIEHRCVTEHDLTEQMLMSAAGQAALQTIQQHWPDAKRISIFCGKGNNAGDGFMVAQLAHQAGFEVIVYGLFDVNTLTSTAAWAANGCIQSAIPIVPWETNIALESDLIVDALLGSGLKGEVKEPITAAIRRINESYLPVFSLDVPSGLDVDTGNCLGIAIKADLTLSFIGINQGLYTHQGPAHCGNLLLNDLGIPSALLDEADHAYFLMSGDELRVSLPSRRKNLHKGDCGHVLVIGGDYGMGGAVRLAAEAAARVGAGLVTVATRPEHVTIVSGTRPEIMCHQVTCAEDLLPLLSRATVVAIGPGLGKSEWAKELLAAVIESQLPMVLDADGLTILSEAPFTHPQWVLTPHPGEAARLLGVNSQTIQADRFHSINKLIEIYGGTCVLKGAGTLVKTENDPYGYACPAGNPGMATGGMGDILSGVIAGLIAQGLCLAKAAEWGVLVHSVAADRAAESGGERGLLATDLLDFLRELVNP